MRSSTSLRSWPLLPLLLFSASTFIFAQAHGHVLYPLPAYPACAQPLTALIADADGNLYGSGSNSGDAHAGCIFKLSPSVGEWRETVLYAFSGSDGSAPYGALVFDTSGNLYGTTVSGGAYDGGVAFKLSPSADGEWTESVLYSFGSGDDARGPQCSLIFDGRGKDWASVVSLEEFFTGVEHRIQDLPEEQRQQARKRLVLAREFVGTQDPLDFFRSWKTPLERYVPLSMRISPVEETEEEEED